MLACEIEPGRALCPCGCVYGRTQRLLHLSEQEGGDERNRTRAGSADPRQPRQPDGRGRCPACLWGVRPRRGPVGSVNRHPRGARAARWRRGVWRQGGHARCRARQRGDRRRRPRSRRQRPAGTGRGDDRARRHPGKVAAGRERDPWPLDGNRAPPPPTTASRCGVTWEGRRRACCRCLA
jgi:hypothetical protein